MASLIALAFNPYAWIVALGLVGAGFASGVLLEHQLANAAGWERQVADLKRAAADREKIASEDSRRATANATEAERLQNELDKLVKAGKPTACRLSADELRRLQRLAR